MHQFFRDFNANKHQSHSRFLKVFLVGAFCQCFFFKILFDTPEVIKIVLPQKLYKTLESRQIVSVGPRN